MGMLSFIKCTTCNLKASLSYSAPIHIVRLFPAYSDYFEGHLARLAYTFAHHLFFGYLVGGNPTPNRIAVAYVIGLGSVCRK